MTTMECISPLHRCSPQVHILGVDTLMHWCETIVCCSETSTNMRARRINPMALSNIKGTLKNLYNLNKDGGAHRAWGYDAREDHLSIAAAPGACEVTSRRSHACSYVCTGFAIDLVAPN